ncbi:MAG: hypothetical protein SFY69_03250 [Planctomycetota bacterium]|nr:hypothetical protein [Planctomycetota bacterium]
MTPHIRASGRGERRAARRGSARSTGLGVAAGVGLVVIGGLAWMVARSPSAGDADAPAPVVAPPPDVRELGTGGGAIQGVGGAGKMFLQVVDPGDPTRIQAEIRADRSEPLAQRRVRMERPSAWVYLEDGRSLLVEGEAGEATVPPEGSDGRPDDVVLTGSVRVRLYDEVPGSARPDPATGVPLVSLATERLLVDAERGELTIPGEFSFRSARADFDGSDLVLVVNEAAGRLERLRVGSTRALVFRPEAASVAGVGTPTGASGSAAPAVSAGDALVPAGSAPVAGGGPSRAPVGPAQSVVAQGGTGGANVETIYHTLASGDVRISRGSQSLAAPAAELFVRLVDNALPPDALGPARAGANVEPARPSGTAPAPTAAPPPAPVVEGSQTPGAIARQDDEAPPDEPVTITWSGALEIRPTTDPPGAMQRQHVYVRCAAEVAGGVVARDTEADVTASGRTLEYGATRRELSLWGAGSSGATLAAPGRGEASASRFDVSLATGRVVVPGAGVLRATGDAPAAGLAGAPGVGQPAGEAGEARVVSWTTEAVFEFAVRDGTMTRDLTRAILTGDARASSEGGALSAKSMTAEFAPDAEGSPALRRLHAVGDATGRDAEGGGVRGDTIDAIFAWSPEGATRLQRVVVDGRAEGVQKNTRLGAGRIEAEFEADEHGDPVARRVLGTGGVRFEGEDDTRATARQLDADPSRRLATLTGDATISRGDSSIHSEQFTLDGAARTLLASGPGSLTHAEASETGPVTARAEVRWTQRLLYDETLARAEVHGEVRGTLTRGRDSTDTLSADRAVLLIDTTPTDEGSRRTVRSVTLTSDSGMCKVEARRYAPGAEPRTLERLLYLEGAEIVADQTRGTLDVPGAGKLLALDRSAAEATTRPGAPGGIGVGQRGTALFTWRGGLTLDRPRGTASLHDDVRLVHQQGEGDSRTDLRCDRLDARFREHADGDARPADAPAGDLLGADASGAVVVMANGRRLDCGQLSYDAPTSLVDAWSRESPVTLTDPQSASPLRAERIKWYLDGDRIELLGVGPVSAPR